MKGQKATEASAASMELLAVLAHPINKDAFWFADIDYDDTATLAQPFEKATKIQGIRPIETGHNTNITAGLELTLSHLRAAERNTDPEGPKFLRPVAILFTDGEHNVGPSPVQAATELKEIADLVTIAYGQNAKEEFLKTLASSSKHFCRTNNGSDLRAYLADVGETLSKSVALGMNASHAIARLSTTRGKE